MTHRILLVEDEANYRNVLAMMMAEMDVELRQAEDGLAALEILKQDDVDLVITDLNMPRMDGMTLLQELTQRPRPPPVVVITAYGTIDSAVDAMRMGAIDYLQKPFDEQRLMLTLKRALRLTDLMAENRRLREAVEERYDFSQIIGQSDAMVSALRIAGKVAGSDSTVLVQGESGTGKELVAKAIHYNSSRQKGPFVAVNVAALPDTLLEAELFGAEAGAYTGAGKRRRGRVELARGGTLFMDEIGDMPLLLQSKLLRVLQEKTFTPLGGEAELKADVRFIFATHRNLEEMVRQGTFREDLMYRVSVLRVELPPLRARGNDVLLLAEAMIQNLVQHRGMKAVTLSASAKNALLHHPFPGNVRELNNVIERAVILADGDVIEASDLSLQEPERREPAKRNVSVGAQWVLPQEGLNLDALEEDLVRQALERTGGNKSRAAKLLGLTRATLRYRIEKMGLGGGEGGEQGREE